jgi:hypothetical protein
VIWSSPLRASTIGAAPTLDEDRSLHPEKRILAYVREHGRISNTECLTLLAVEQQRASYLYEEAARRGRAGEAWLSALEPLPPARRSLLITAL